MATPVSTPLRIAAGAVAAYALWTGVQRHREYQSNANIAFTKYGQDTYQQLATEHFYQGTSGNAFMDRLAHRWRVFTTYGPGNIFPLLKKTELQAGTFISSVLLTPETLLGVGALYIAGIPVHKAITEPTKWLWANGMKNGLYHLGRCISSSTPMLGNIFQGAAKFLFTGPGLLLAAAGGLLLWRFDRTLKGTERAEFFQADLGGYNPYAANYMPQLAYENERIL